MWTDDDERKERLVLELVVAEDTTSSADYVGREVAGEHVADQHGWLALVAGFHQQMADRRKQARAGGGRFASYHGGEFSSSAYRSGS